MVEKTLEGTWEEIATQGDLLVGKRVRLTILANDAPGGHFYETASADEWSRALKEWAQSHPETSPGLSEEAISRESIYGERLDAVSR